MAAPAEIDPFLFDLAEAVQAYAAGHEDAALRAAPAPPAARPVWGQAPDALEQLLAGAILRDGTGAAVVAAYPIIVQAPNAGGVMAPHVSVYTAANSTTLLPHDLVQRFGTEYLPRVGLPGFVATAGGVQVTAAFSPSTAPRSIGSRCRRPACSSTRRRL
jgi:hypothetical protein